MTAATPPLPQKQPAADGKVYFSYADIHESMKELSPHLIAQNFDVMIAIGGGGFIPARILRTYLNIPVLAVSLELYDDKTNTVNQNGVVCHQWFDPQSEPGQLVEGGRVLIVDEVDDTRTTLQYCVEEVQKRCQPASLAVAVVHNKQKPKVGILPSDVAYFAGQEVPDHWNCYPWDAGAYGRSIRDHEALARECDVVGLSNK